MEFQKQLDDLEQRVAEIKASVAAATTETHQQLEERVGKAEADTDRKLDEARQHVGAAAEGTQTSWEQARADARARVAELKSKARHRRDKIDADLAATDADIAEADAEAAIDYAAWTIESTKLAILEALSARMRADEKADRLSGTL